MNQYFISFYGGIIFHCVDTLYSKSPTYEPSSCKLSKMWTCIWFQQGTRTCAINVRHEWNCSLSSISYCQLLCYTTVLFKVLYCKIKNIFFIFCLFFMYYLCEKYYKPITLQYYIVDCVSWVPRLTLLDSQTTWT